MIYGAGVLYVDLKRVVTTRLLCNRTSNRRKLLGCLDLDLGSVGNVPIAIGLPVLLLLRNFEQRSQIVPIVYLVEQTKFVLRSNA